MKRWAPLVIILVIGVAAIVMSERRALHINIGPHALMYWFGDTQREVTRIPARIVRLSDADEIAIGDELAAHSASALPPDAQDMQSYIDLVGARLAVHATRRLPYKFHYIAERSFENAYALPGGHVFIGAGLIRHMQTEDELASVLGHEIEHVDRYHCAERATVEAAARQLGVIGEIAALPAELFMAGYSKEQELEADREGVRLAVASGYSPYGARDVLERFGKVHEASAIRMPGSPVGEVARVPMQSLSDYFRSHPPAEERVAAIDALIAREHWKQRNQTPLRVHVTTEDPVAAAK
jgi:predicted Zn-dependent protease